MSITSAPLIGAVRPSDDGGGGAAVVGGGVVGVGGGVLFGGVVVVALVADWVADAGTGPDGSGRGAVGDAAMPAVPAPAANSPSTARAKKFERGLGIA
jgi:hypothetical protein